MKLRNGFVSNSSSSSFICMVDGSVEAGMDLSLSEAGMCSCVNGHTFCTQYRLAKPQIVQDLDIEDYDEDDELYDNDDYDIPENQCPICTLHHIGDDDLLAYAIKKNNWSRKLMEDSFRADFADYQAFQREMKK